MILFSWLKKFSFLSFCILFSAFSLANVIRFPEKELAEEYVFPIFKDPQAVLNRNVTLGQRVEIKLFGFFRPDEPFYFPLGGLANLSFYLSESHGIGLSTLFFYPGLNSRGEEMKTQGHGIKNEKGEPVSYFDASLAPVPFLGGFLNYYFSPLYGKISLTKKTVFNFAFYSFLGLGGWV